MEATTNRPELLGMYRLRSNNSQFLRCPVRRPRHLLSQFPNQDRFVFHYDSSVFV